MVTLGQSTMPKETKMKDDVAVEKSNARNQTYVRKDPPLHVSASDAIHSKGILHFTIGVRDHLAAAKFYSEVLGCKHLRSNDRYCFMETNGSYFVLTKMPKHVNPNEPGEDAHHHAFLVELDEFDRAMEILIARNIEIIKYSDENHRSFPGRHAYFHDADGNAIEICALYTDP
jgi:catechol 2,3-dioxygenase-like lactoylglutathione lyase family enzyme